MSKNDDLENAIRPIRPNEPSQTGAVVALGSCENPECSFYGKPVPVSTKGNELGPDGERQTMKCPKCKTTLSVLLGENGADFQRNLDTPSNSDG